MKADNYSTMAEIKCDMNESKYVYAYAWLHLIFIFSPLSAFLERAMVYSYKFIEIETEENSYKTLYNYLYYQLQVMKTLLESATINYINSSSYFHYL